MALTQVYNSKSKKWVLLDDAVKGGIKKMAAEPFEGVPVKGETPAKPEPEKTPAHENLKDDNIPSAAIDEDSKNNDQPDDESDSGGDSGGGGWLSALGF